MAEHNEIGILGESIAMDFLIENGYQIRAQNWRFSRAELDIVAIKDQTLVVVEVKTRSSAEFENPKEAVTKSKQKKIIKAANAYIEEFDIDLECRFDIISVLIQNKKPEIEHIQDAFYPTL